MRWLATSALAASILVPLSASQNGSGVTVWSGTYSKEQAARGADAYRRECASCHGPSLAGGETGPPLAGSVFLESWMDATIGDLYERIAISMPQEKPGSLTPQTYADIVARMLERNDFPAGSSELPADAAALKNIRITTKP
jgi:S-disulfanyl-L-cysteine oxidoreductase SoxD